MVPRTGTRGAARAGAVLAALGMTVALLSGCGAEAPYGAETYSGEMDVARQFMSALEDGRTATALSLTNGDLGIRLDATTSAFFESAEARPRNAAVLSAVESGDTDVYVDVRFQLAGDDRDIKLRFERGQSTPRISGWLFAAMGIEGSAGGGKIVVSDLLDYPLSPDMQQIVLLPGRYSFRYQGPGPASGQSFFVDFPVDHHQLEQNLPKGLSMPYTSLKIDDAG